MAPLCSAVPRVPGQGVVGRPRPPALPTHTLERPAGHHRSTLTLLLLLVGPSLLLILLLLDILVVLLLLILLQEHLLHLLPLVGEHLGQTLGGRSGKEVDEEERRR